MAKNVTTQQIDRAARWADRWENVRASGRWRFIWLRGVAGRGMPWTFFMLAWRWWESGLRPGVLDVLMTIFIGIAGGIAFGAFTWRSAERRYQRWLAGHAATVARAFE